MQFLGVNLCSVLLRYQAKGNMVASKWQDRSFCLPSIEVPSDLGVDSDVRLSMRRNFSFKMVVNDLTSTSTLANNNI